MITLYVIIMIVDFILIVACVVAIIAIARLTRRPHRHDLALPIPRRVRGGHRSGRHTVNGPCDFHNHPPYVDVVMAAAAYRELTVCYRLDKRPSERLFTALKKAGETMDRTICPPAADTP